MRGRKPKKLDLKPIIFAYTELGLSIKEIADGLNVSDRTLRTRLERAGVHIRSTKEHYQKENKRILDAINAATRYREGESQRNLVTESHIPPESIRKYLQENGIRIRTSSQQLKFWHKKKRKIKT